MDTMRAAEQENLHHSPHEVDNADVGHDVLSFEEERTNLRETGECCILKQCEGSAFGRIEAETLCGNERSCPCVVAWSESWCKGHGGLEAVLLVVHSSTP